MTTEEKALELVAENRVVPVSGAELHDRIVIVAGTTDHYIVRAGRNGVECECPASTKGKGKYCSHALAAMIWWADQREVPFG